jgi:regulatory protein
VYDRRSGGRRRRGRRTGDAGSGSAGLDGSPEPDGERDPEAGPDADPEAVARAICLRQLTAGPRTKAQLAEALARRAVPSDVAERVLDRFEDVGLIDDAAFAAAWVGSRHAGRGLARRALASELRRRGVADPVIEDAVAGLDPDQELATARALVARRLPGTRGLPLETRLRRLGGMLARKGYPPGVAFRVVREALEHEGQGIVGVPDLDD